jgi:hypothetical protein
MEKYTIVWVLFQIRPIHLLLGLSQNWPATKDFAEATRLETSIPATDVESRNVADSKTSGVKPSTFAVKTAKSVSRRNSRCPITFCSIRAQCYKTFWSRIYELL